MNHFCGSIFNGSFLRNIISTKFGTVYSENFNPGESELSSSITSRFISDLYLPVLTFGTENSD